MTENNFYYLGKLGKPHGLLGFQYINIEMFFRDLNLSGLIVSIDQKEYRISKFKKHLKDRNLIKFENIDSIDESETLRDSEVFISSKFKNVVNKSNLPWPKFFIGDVLSDNINLIDYFYTAKLIMCKISINNEEIVVFYDKNNFKYIDNKLYLTIN